MESQKEELQQSPTVGDAEIEEIVIRAFREVLDSPGDVDAGTDFFESGGNSILGARLVARIRRELRIKVTIRDLFRSRDPRALASAIRERHSRNAAG